MKPTIHTPKGFSIQTLFSVVFFFALSFSMQSQTNSNSENIQSDKKELVSKSNANESNFEFVSWFMGTKQNINPIESSEENTTKKMLINARVAPNRTLMKAFLKKAQNQNSSLS